MASLIRTLTFTTASIAPAAASSTNQTIIGNICDIVKIKVVPSVVTAGELTSVFIYKRNTFSASDIVYSTSSFSGSLIDPIETDGITTTERNQGFIAKYFDLDNAQQLHIKIVNSGTVSRTFDVTVEYILYDVPVISVLQFGATGDGSTNDSAAIQRAIDFAGGTGRATIITFPRPVGASGTYLIGTKLNIDFNTTNAITLRGENREGTILRTTGTGTTILEVKNGTGGLGAVFGVTLEDLYFLGPGATSTVAGVIFEDARNCTLNRVKITGFDKGLSLRPGTTGSAQSCNDFAIRDCWFSDNNTINLDCQNRTDHLSLYNFYCASSATGIKFVGGTQLRIFGGNFYSHTLCDIDIDEVNTPGFALGVDLFLQGLHFEYSTSTGGNIRIGNTNIVNGVTISGCTFAAGAGIIPINAIRYRNLVLSGNLAYYYTGELVTHGAGSTLWGFVELGTIVNIVGAGVHGGGTVKQNKMGLPLQLNQYAAGTWTQVAFNAGDFTASGAMTWTVAAGDVGTFMYTIIEKTMTVCFNLNTTSIGGVVSTDLKILIPASKIAIRQVSNPVTLLDNGTRVMGRAFINSLNDTFITIQRLDAGNFTAAADTTYVIGQLTFEIQ